MGRQPQLVAAVFASLASPDVAAIECQQQMGAVMDGIIIRAIGEPQPPDHAERTRIIGHVWYSSLVGWVNGWSDMDRVRDELAVAVRLLLPNGLVPNGRSRLRPRARCKGVAGLPRRRGRGAAEMLQPTAAHGRMRRQGRRRHSGTVDAQGGSSHARSDFQRGRQGVHRDLRRRRGCRSGPGRGAGQAARRGRVPLRPLRHERDAAPTCPGRPGPRGRGGDRRGGRGSGPGGRGRPRDRGLDPSVRDVPGVPAGRGEPVRGDLLQHRRCGEVLPGR